MKTTFESNDLKVKRIYLSVLIVSCFYANPTQAQPYDLNEIETFFLQNNYSLIAKKFLIAESEALLVQEKLLPNPTFSISEVNLWKNGTTEELPYLFGKYGQTQQISLELEQLIETAGKRKKRMAVKQGEVKQSVFEFEELLRSLKKDLRLTYWNLFRVKESQQQTNALLQLFKQLNEQYSRQSQLQNISRADAYRAQTAFLNLQAENAELLQEQSELLLTLQQLTQLSDLQISQLKFPELTFDLSKKLPLNLKDNIQQQHIGIQLQNNQIDLAQKQLLLEEAQRVPDLNFQVNYDRGGNIMRDFVGLGVSFDLLVFNKNKGNISAAKHKIDFEKVEKKALEKQIESETDFALKQVMFFEDLLKQKNDLNKNESDELLQNFYKHLQNKNITLLEFIDFTQAHLEAEKAYNQWLIEYFTNYEQLQYLVGKDF